MRHRRQRRGFVPAGALPLDGLGLPKARTREMALAQAWFEVAGPAICLHARASRVVRGVLEIEVADGAWADALTDLLPALGGLLAAAHPELGVRRFRLLRSGSGDREAARDLGPAVEPAVREPSPAGARSADDSLNHASDWESRLPELARRYLARREG